MVVNELEGVVQNIESANGVYFFEIDIAGETFFALQLHNGFNKKTHVRVRFREGDISIAKQIEPKISISNIHKAVVKGIENGNLLARIELNYKERSLYSLITGKSLKKLNIKIGDEVYFLVKALSVEVFCE